MYESKHKKTFTIIGKGLANNVIVANKAEDYSPVMTTLLYSYSPLGLRIRFDIHDSRLRCILSRQYCIYFLLVFASHCLPANQTSSMHAAIIAVFHGCRTRETISWPIKDTKKIMIAFPAIKAYRNVLNGMADKPDTMLIKADGENGKHARRKMEVNPLLSIRRKNDAAFGYRFIIHCENLFPNFLDRPNRASDPRVTPSHEYRKPCHNP